MDEMISYIFNGLKFSEKELSSLNRKLTFAIIVGGLYLTDTRLCCRRHNAEIKTLTKQIEELKKMKGE